jgi:hypothetical protein
MPIDLVGRRLDRLEKAQRVTNDTLTRVVSVLEAHSRHFERMEEALIGIAERVDGVGARMDRLTAAIARGRTQDLARLDDHDRRISAIEGRRRRKR